MNLQLENAAKELQTEWRKQHRNDCLQKIHERHAATYALEAKINKGVNAKS